MKINSILIVGGGSAGWMTAAGLSSFFPPEDKIKISLVESKTIPTVGVGESTIADRFNEFLIMCGLKDEDWMPHCNAAYKNSLRFTDFRDVGTSFEYPFGNNYYGKTDLKAWSYLTAKYDLPPESFAEFHCENTFLAYLNKGTKNKGEEIPGFDFRYDTAYHFDAKLFTEYLKDNVALPKGLEHYYDDIVGVEKDDDGYITSVIGKSDTYSADLIIDCTGFKSLILEEEMGSEWMSFKPWLSNDRALATHVPYHDKEKELMNVTECIGMPNGWCWLISLWNHQGMGYVYSSDFVDDDTAEAEFRAIISKRKGYDVASEAEIKPIRMRHGAHKKAWIKNVVGIGLSYAFIEPLESTGLLTAYSNIIRIADLIKNRNYNVNRFDIDGFNLTANHEVNGYRDFVAAHFGLSSRCDTPYWKYQTQERSYVYPSTDDWDKVRVSLFQQSFDDNFAAAMYSQYHYQEWSPIMRGWIYIMGGMGYKPMSSYEYFSKPNPDAKIEGWLLHRSKMEEYVKTLPSSYQFLKDTIYG